jgi:hypothetical protein
MRMSRDKLKEIQEKISKIKAPKISLQRLADEEKHVIADALSFLIAYEMEESSIFLEEGFDSVAQEFRQKAEKHIELWEKITGTKYDSHSLS